MSDWTVAAQQCGASGATTHVFERFRSRETKLGSLAVQRALPIREKRLVGPWCFLDRFGPHAFAEEKAMDVAPHPHIGLQTVSWLLEGELVHKDSLDSECSLRPGRVNVMTAGNGIAHAEETPVVNSGRLNGVQLWVALPEGARHGAPEFQHVSEAPVVEQRGGSVSVFAGSLLRAQSITRHFSPILGLDVAVRARSIVELPLEPSFEHAALLLAGDAEVCGGAIDTSGLCYLGVDRSSIEVSSRLGARLLLIGGPPFAERILIWWNFVARTPEEIAKARAEWEKGERFGEVRRYSGPRLRAPELMRLAAPNPVS